MAQTLFFLRFLFLGKGRLTFMARAFQGPLIISSKIILNIVFDIYHFFITCIHTFFIFETLLQTLSL